MRFSLSVLLPSLVGLALASGGVEMELAHRSSAISPKAAIRPHTPNEGLYDPADGLLKRGPRDERTLVLTFDDGPNPDSAERLLDELDDLNVKATFFVVGERVNLRPDLVRRMIAEGHEVGNHTEHHQRLFDLPDAKVAKELKGCEDAVRGATGRSMNLMRPPGMHFTPKVLEVAKRMGYVTVDVNNVCGDYGPHDGMSNLTPESAEELGLTAPVLADRVERQFKPGTIILLHDNPVSVSAVPEIVARARAQGYRFVTTAALMASLPEPVRVVANPPLREEAKGKG